MTAASGPPSTADRVMGGRIALAQPARGYRAAIDPVLLAASVQARPGERVLDLGTGVGTAALCLTARLSGVAAVGLELQADLAAFAAANARANGLDDRFAIVVGDVARLPIRGGGFDQVMANPPYLRAGAHTASPDPGKRLADTETVPLAAWVAAAAAALRPRGRLTLIHRADRLDEVCAALRPRFGAVEVMPLWPKPGRPAGRVIVRARLAAAGPGRLWPGLMLHAEDGAYTGAAQSILRDGAPLPWGR